MTILRDTLERARAADATLSARFYDRLFGAHPELRPLFARRPLEAVFDEMVNVIVDPPADIAALAGSHARYGIVSQMYGWVGISLIATLAAACGDAWTVEADKAWRAAYTGVAKAMLDGAGFAYS
jgi:hemoglobin-like flavoprotein